MIVTRVVTTTPAAGHHIADMRRKQGRSKSPKNPAAIDPETKKRWKNNRSRKKNK